jgi:hypothetical protein
MEEDTPELNGPNAEANKDPTQKKVAVQPIKSDKDVVGGVLLGSIDNLDLNTEQYNQMVDKGVASALRFKPARALAMTQTPAVKFRNDVFVGAASYLSTRNAVVRPLAAMLAKADPSIKTAADRRHAVTALVLERTLNARFQDIVNNQRDQNLALQNILKFQTSTATTYMQQGLGLNFRQLYATNTMVTLLKAFADMAENKLEAIKINTKIPDGSKPLSIFRRLKDSVVKTAFDQGGKAIVEVGKKTLRSKVAPAVADYLEHSARPDLHLTDKLSTLVNKFETIVRGNKTGARVLDAVQPRAQAAAAAIKPFTDHIQANASKLSDKYNLKDRFHPDVLWEKGSSQREKLANLLRSVSGTNTTKIEPADGIPAHKPETTVSTKGSRAPPPIIRKDINDLVTKHLEKIYDLLDARIPKPVRENSFTDHNDKEQDELGHPVEGAARKAGGSFGLPFGFFDKKGGPGSPSNGGGSRHGSDKSPSGTPGHPGKPDAPESTLDWLWRNAVEGAAWGAGEIGLKKAAVIPAAAILAYKNRATIALKLRGLKTVGGLAFDGLKFRSGATAATTTTMGGADLAKMAEDVISRGEINVAKATELASKNPEAAEFIAGRLGFKSAEEMIARGVKESGAHGLHIAEKEGVKAAEAGVKTAATGTKAADWVARFGTASKTAAGVGESAATKSATKVGKSAAAKAGTETLAKVGEKSLGKSIAKKIPFLGLGIGTVFAVQRAVRGDWTGAGLEMASGVASTLPGWGTAGSIAIDAGLFARDMYTKPLEKGTPEGKKGPLLSARLKAYGADVGQAEVVLALERRVYAIIKTHKEGSIHAGDLKIFAKAFGFDPNNAMMMSYFRQWVMGRMVAAFTSYLKILENNHVSIESESSIPSKTVAIILDAFNQVAAVVATKYQGVKPTAAGFADSIKTQGITPPGARPMGPTGDKPQASATGGAAGMAMPASATTSASGTLPSAMTPPSTLPIYTSAPFSNSTQASNPIAANSNQTSAPIPSPSYTTPASSYMPVPAPQMDSAPTRSNGGPPLPASPVGGHYSAMPNANPAAGSATIAKLTYDSGLRAPGSPANTNTRLPDIMGGSGFNQKAPSIMANLMKDFGFTKEQAAGVVGNIGHESGGFKEMQEKNPLGGGRGGLGWAQWTGPRRVDFEKYCAANKISPTSDEANYGFLKHELQTTYKSTVSAVKQAGTAGQAMQIFEKHYEAAGVKNYASRQNYVDNALASYSTSAPGEASPQVAAASNDNAAPGSPPSAATPGSGPLAGVQATQGSGAPGAPMGTQLASANASAGASADGAGIKALPRGAVGSGQCVALVQNAAGIGHTSTWQAGGSVMGNPNLKPGTAIATFDQNGKYGNHTNGSSHAAIYLGPSKVYPGGIQVYDQWSGQPAHVRDIRPNGGTAVNSANAFQIVKTPNQPQGVVAKAFAAPAQVNLDNAVATGALPTGKPDASTVSANAPDGKTPPAGTTSDSPNDISSPTAASVAPIASDPSSPNDISSPSATPAPSATASNTSDASAPASPPPSSQRIMPPAAQTNSTVAVGPGPSAPPPSAPSQPSAPPPMPTSATAGPSQNVMAPMRNATSNAQNTRRQAMMAATQSQQLPPPSTQPQMPMTHPDLLASTKATADAMSQLIRVSSGIHNSLEGLHKTTKDAYGKDGVFAAMQEQQAKAKSPQQNIVAPTINQAPQPDKKKGSDDGLDVSKKREPRYAA